jgi:hypothetical protein
MRQFIEETMKNFIILSLMTAGSISFAQTSKIPAIPAFSKQAIMGFENNLSKKKIVIFEIKAQTPTTTEALEKALEDIKKKQPVLNPSNNFQESIGGGWQPQVNDPLTLAVRGYINELSNLLGANCDAMKIATRMQNAPLEMSSDVEIEITQLNEQSQSCLRK